MKKLVCLLCISILCFGLQSCGSSGKAEKKGKVTLTVWDFKYGEEKTGGAFKKMDEMFMQENPDITINHVGQPEANYYELLISSFTAKNDVDVVITHTDNRAWNLASYFTDLDPYIKDVVKDYSPLAMKAVSSSHSSDKDIKLLPLTAQGVGIYYNKKNLMASGIDVSKTPSSWKEFTDACAAMKKAGITPIIMGNKGDTFGIDFLYRVILGTMYGDGLSGFSDGTAKFTDAKFIEATRMIKELFDKKYINTTNGSIPYFMDAINDFKAGKGGFFVGLTSDIAHWKDFGDALGYDNIGYFPSPVESGVSFPSAQVNQGAGLGLAVVNYSKNIEAAVKYIKFYSSGSAGKVLMDASGALVPNSTIPVDSNNKLLVSIMDSMNKNGVPDYMNIIPGGMVKDFYNFQYLFFVSNETKQDVYVAQIEKLYESSLKK